MTSDLTNYAILCAHQHSAGYHPTPEGAFATTPSAHNLANSLREMLNVYWDEGDGETPPHFIQQAQILVEAFDRQSKP